MKRESKTMLLCLVLSSALVLPGTAKLIDALAEGYGALPPSQVAARSAPARLAVAPAERGQP